METNNIENFTLILGTRDNFELALVEWIIENRVAQ